jgi:phosphotransferase system HPr (HPr) family protein
MTETSLRIRSQVVIIDPLGLHLRQAAKLVALAKSFRSDIRVFCRGGTANAKSILDLATLAAECGMVLDIEAHGPDAKEAITAATDVLSPRLIGSVGQTAAA